jgi:outer membrane biosynthesis protein TonB
MAWLEEAAGPNFAPAVLWTLLALVVLVIVLVVVRVVRSMTFGTFVAGGRNRKTRLAVMDAAAVDSQRRLVLVRRDDVEHLILIGGPTDLLVERDIRLHAPSRRPVAAEPAEAARPRPAEVPAQPRAERPAQQPKPEPKPEQRIQQAALSLQVPPAKAAPATPVRPAAVRMPQAAPAPPAQSFSTQPPRPTPGHPANNTPPAPPKLKPLDAPSNDLSFGATNKARPPRPEMSLEDEMNRLLGELSGKK